MTQLFCLSAGCCLNSNDSSGSLFLTTADHTDCCPVCNIQEILSKTIQHEQWQDSANLCRLIHVKFHQLYNDSRHLTFKDLSISKLHTGV